MNDPIDFSRRIWGCLGRRGGLGGEEGYSYLTLSSLLSLSSPLHRPTSDPFAEVFLIWPSSTIFLILWSHVVHLSINLASSLENTSIVKAPEN